MGSIGMKAGFIGTGSIGAPLATNILDQENSLAVFDINIDATKSLAEKQARVLSSPTEVADEAEVIFACMPSIESFRTIVSGPDGVLVGGAKSDAARGAAAQALLDRGYGMSVAVSMDIVDEGQAHLDALQELAERRQRINREKTPAEATKASPGWPLDGGPSA